MAVGPFLFEQSCRFVGGTIKNDNVRFLNLDSVGKKVLENCGVESCHYVGVFCWQWDLAGR